MPWGGDPPDRPVDIVFLHANGFNALTYQRDPGTARRPTLRVLALDQRGHGLTTLPDCHGRRSP